MLVHVNSEHRLVAACAGWAGQGESSAKELPSQDRAALTSAPPAFTLKVGNSLPPHNVPGAF